jgi:magnesium transporter
VDVRLVTSEGVQRREPDEVKELLARGDGVIWVDIPEFDEQARHLLLDVFGFHPRAVQDCEQRNPVPKLHAYPGHVFSVLHAPEPGAGGHVHYVELDQFVGDGFLVTVHGPLNPAVKPEAALRETRAVVNRLENGRFRPSMSYEISSSLVTALILRLRSYLDELTAQVWKAEQRVTGGGMTDAEEFLDEMFRVRHGLLTVRTMSALSREVYGRMSTLNAFGTGKGKLLLDDLVDQFQRIATVAEGQKDYLQGVIEFYQTRTNTKLTIAAERLAVIAAVTLPVTALSSIVGMNVIVNDSTHWETLILLLVIMAVMSTMLLVWAKRKGGW